MEWRGDDIDEDSVIEPDNEVEGDAGDPESLEGQAVAKVKKLRAEIASLRKEKQEYMDGWQRAKADYVNALKRFDEERASAKTQGLVKAVEALLPALDALERAKAGGELPAGFASIAKQLESAFQGLGLEAVGQEGELFNPSSHEALGTDPTDVCEIDDTVSAVLEKGWRVGDPSNPSGQGTLIRPAKVRVYHYAK